MTTENNKLIVQQALGALVATGDVEALAPLLSDGFVHHRPDANDRGKAAWLDAVRAALVPLEGMRVEIKHVLADGDHVVMHSRRGLPGGADIVVVDVWRLDDGLIAEAWEIIEPVAEADAHLSWWEEPAGR
ncbi:nuclear transport factor 2 family protein [Nonomuraea soli]|uniref:Putative SnoaL-like aldol condensation-catalyzing enzyme n=1 Tax=Nonomuraea soli TaxID=1032476 RepID=A0A7W0CG13_9ACTN|nr:nuclear transport factor 2 family protein [Nonomuraea soli]MBA2890312.1 putative SnoaL-like aldol condensation-catalyzing enzyme [Nonomuraea soli]